MNFYEILHSILKFHLLPISPRSVYNRCGVIAMTTEQKEALYGQIWTVYDSITTIEALIDEIINDETQKIRVDKIKKVLNTRSSNQN